jgi:hypothetical protein
MTHVVQHFHFVVHHLLVAFDIFLQDDLDGDLAGGAVCFADDAIGTSTEGPPETILGSTKRVSAFAAHGYGFVSLLLSYFLS